MRCPSCRLEDARPPRCDRCGVALSGSVPQEAALPPLPLARKVRSEPLTLVDAGRYELWAVPAALAIAALVVATPPGRFLVGASAEMEMHELGHATALWLAGRFALPLPMFTLSDGGRSAITFVLVAVGLAYLAAVAIREHLPHLIAFSGVAALALCLGTLGLSGDALDSWVKFAGMGGEFWLSTLLMLAFPLRMPASWRWAQSRWFFLGWGALAFAADARRWLRAEIPWGSFWGGDGDMGVLAARGWTEPQLVHAYRWVGVLCVLALAAQLALRGWRIWKTQSS